MLVTTQASEVLADGHAVPTYWGVIGLLGMVLAATVPLTQMQSGTTPRRLLLSIIVATIALVGGAGMVLLAFVIR